LRRAATFLRKIGIEIGFEREGRARTRIIRITTGPSPLPETGGARPSPPSAPSAIPPTINPANGFASGSRRTVGDSADGPVAAPVSTVRDNPLKSNNATDADGADANHHPRSGRGDETVPGWRMRL
jgi:hypothetical protein